MDIKEEGKGRRIKQPRSLKTRAVLNR